MLEHLTNYLLQYRTVTVPNVGTLHLVQEPPRLNVADKQIEPPSYVVKITSEENIPDHQLNFLRLANKDGDAVATKLQFFGNSLRQKMLESGFEWEGLGRLTSDTREVVLNAPALEPLPAQKVIRQDVGHSVLVGDKEISSAQVFERQQAAGLEATKRRTAVWIGWVLLVILVLLAFLVLYVGKFRTTAAGSRLAPASWILPDF